MKEKKVSKEKSASKKINEHYLKFITQCCQTSTSRKAANDPFMRVASAYWHWCSDKWLEPVPLHHLRTRLMMLKGAAKLTLNAHGRALAARNTQVSYSTSKGE